MKDIFTITHIANAGLMVTAGDTRILVDAPQGGSYPFDGVPEAALTGMLSGSGPYARADALLFTHTHADHFSASLAQAYLSHCPGAVCILPFCSAADTLDNATHIETVGALPRAFRVGDVRIDAQRGAHVGPPNAGDNVVYRIAYGQGSLLVTGDADPESVDLAALGHADAAVINVLFWHSPAGRRALDTIVTPSVVFVHHLPFASDSEDKRVTFYRRMFERDLMRDLDKHAFPLVPLTAPGQAETVPAPAKG